MRITRTLLLWLAATLAGAAQSPPTGLDRGFHAMYDLRFDEARREVREYRKDHPEDPMASIADASALLFGEFERLKILQTELFASDEKFDAREKPRPDPMLRGEFESTLLHAEEQAKQMLGKDAKSKDALFTLALASGLRADYAALIEKRNFAALGFTKSATEYAERLLVIAPDYYDAYLSTGLGKLLIGAKPAPVRWVLRLGGYKGNVDEGKKELRIVAEKGRYLASFAQLLLAVAYLRDQKREEARKLLIGLRDRYPNNPLYAQEVVKLEK
ncbi:MAG: hypothetical protein HYX26_00845 [Acidobacteriales bacterium]|nr:hypothetical protein [Terriglobales bacterium]